MYTHFSKQLVFGGAFLKGILEKIMRIAYDEGFLVKIRKMIDNYIRALVRSIVRFTTDVDEKKILFLNFSGNYDCNPKAICQELIDENVDAKLVWGTYKRTKVGDKFFPSNVQFTIRDTYDFYKQISSAKVIVDNGVSTAWLNYTKKKNQYLIETWHGSIGIKKFGRDSNKDMNWLKLAEKEGKMTDFIISNSDFEDDVYREDFWKKTPIWKFGHARNDILFCEDEKKIESIRNRILEWYNLPSNLKLCMYAPTFRDDGDMSPYDIDYERLVATLAERFGGEWVVLTRFHSKTRKLLSRNKVVLPPCAINVTDYPDIQELMLIIDVGITDYSSWICEYMVTRKPGFTFATDIDSYSTTERSFFFPLSDYPFPTTSTQEGLFKNILEFDNDKYVCDCNNFLKEKGSVDDGHASERIVAEIKKLIGE